MYATYNRLTSKIFKETCIKLIDPTNWNAYLLTQV